MTRYRKAISLDIVALFAIALIIAVGLGIYLSSISKVTTTTITETNIGVREVNGTASIGGTGVVGTLDVVYPNASESGNANASKTSATLNFDCSNCFFVINSDSRVVLNITIIGNANTVNIDGSSGLNLVFQGSSNKLFVMPQSVPIYSKQVNGTGNQVQEQPLPP